MLIRFNTTEIHVSSLKSIEGGLDFAFNNNIKWIPRQTWHTYLWKYYFPFVLEQCKQYPNICLDKREHIMSPLGCDISKAHFKKSGIKEIHETLISLISEYSLSSHRWKEINLCTKALSNIYIDTYLKFSKHKIVVKCGHDSNNHSDASMNDFERIVKDVTLGRLQMSARRITTLNISRGSTDDCSITTNDWIWCFKRVAVDMDKTFHVVIRIIRV